MDFIWNDLLVNPMTNALIFLSNVLFDNFGLSIIAFTLVIRGATYPLTLRQLRTTRKLQEMQPRLQEIQKKYKDPRRRQEEMMKLYRDVGFNPLGCAVPLLVQLPIWIALYQVIRSTIGTSPEALLGLSGRLYDWDFITEAVPLNSSFLWLNLGTASIPLALLVALATFYQQKFNPRAPARDERTASMNRTMLWMMPILFGFFAIQFPSGLALYWITTSLFSIVTSYLYNGHPALTARWLVNGEGLPVPAASQASALAAPISSNAATSAADSGTADQAARPPTRRRRRRSKATAQTGREGTGTSHGTSET